MAIITGTPNHDKKLGTAQADTLTGLDGNDTLAGQSGNDILKGDNGADSLDGGTGNDQLSGGTGNDVLLGGSGNDSLNGAEDSDTLDGGAGADTLDGGTGADNMTGGDGNDLYFVDNIGDRVIETAAQKSTDSVLSTIRYVLPDFVEHLQLLGDSALSGTGNALKNRITGNAADNLLLGMDGQDTLSGSDGADTLDGGSGADSLVGGSGDDTYLIGNTEDKIVETADGGDSDRIVSSISYSLIRHIETLTLTGTANLQGEGNDAANLLEGNSGANKLSGGAGDDTLPGHDGNDTLAGGSGDDQLQGGTGDDTAFYSNPLEGYQLSFDDESQEWTVTDIDPGNGDEGTDSLTGIERAQFADQTLNLSAKPTLTTADVTQAEGTGSTDTGLTFSLSLSEASALPVSVDYTLQANTAEASSDYVAATGTLVFEPGTTRQTLPVSLKADSLDESDETFMVVLSNIVGGTLATSQATGTIRDDDDAVLSATTSTVTFSEGDSGSLQAQVTVQLSTPSAQTVQVDYFTLNGTARVEQDYTAATGTLHFAPGTTRQDILIPIQGDTVDEADETFTLVLARPQNARLDTAASRVSVNITDNDPRPILSVTPAVINEGDAGRQLVTFTLNLSNPSAEAVLAEYVTVNETAVSGIDYLPVSGTLRLPPGETSKTLTVPVLADTLNEADKTLGLSLTNLQNASLPTTTLPAVITIKNDDPLPVATIAAVTLDEGNEGTSQASLAVVLANASGQTVSLSYATASGTASEGTDYTPVNGTLNFSPGETRQTLTIPIAGDTLQEPDETFSVILSNLQNVSVQAMAGTALVSIRNDDAPPSLSMASVTLAEGQSGIISTTLAISLSAPSYQTVTVNYTLMDGTAITGQDYTAGTGTITFVAGETRKTVTIPIVGDSLYENDETLTVRLEAPQNATLDASASTATLTVKNDDAMPSLAVANRQVSEGNDTATALNLTLTLSAASALLTTVDYATANGTALAGSDYTATRGQIEFAPGETRKTLSIPVIGDTLNELDETFTLALSNPRNAIVSSVAGLAQLTLTNDDPQPVLSLAAVQISEGQNGNNRAALTASLSAPSGLPVTVKYTTRDGTAKAGSDYTTTTGTLTFNPGETTRQIEVPVTGDILNEADETLTVALSEPQNTQLSATAATATLTLLNDDAVPGLSIAGLSITEGNSGTSNATVAVTLTPASGQTVTVNYATAEGTATAGKDYTAQSGSLTFNPGETVKTVTIPVMGDNLNEIDETLSITLSNARNAIVDTASGTASLILKNDDPAPVLSVTGTSLNEGQGDTATATITASLSAASAQTVTVSYATAAGTARENEDYLPLSGQLVFTPGETSKTLDITVNGDKLNEADETFTLALTNPQNASLTAPADKATLTIKNDDATPVLSIADTRVTEGSSGTTQASVTVSLSAASGQVVTARYATADATAKAGSDYTATTGAVSFAPGETSQTLTIPVTADSEVETDETFTLALTAPQNATLSTTASKATVTIANDDIALPTLSLADNETTEGNSGSHDLQLTATLSTAFDRVVTVNYTTVDDTATAGDDYTAQSGTLTFAPGITRQTLSIPVAGDSVQESSEQFKILLSNVQNAKLGAESALGRITNDDISGVTFDGFEMTLTDAADNLQGSYRNDWLDGAAGNDTLTGNGGTDLLIGNVGDDTLTGNGTLDGGLGNDAISGSGMIDAGPGNDTVTGGSGDDVITTGSGADSVDGGVGSDQINTGEGDDSITAQDGADTLWAGAGNDVIRHPGINSAEIPSALLIDAGEGDDTIYGGANYYYRYVSPYYYNYYGANDTLLGGAGNDVIGLVGSTNYESGEYGNDSMDGGAGNDTLYGGGGNDTLIGGTGNDLLWGDHQWNNDHAADRFIFNPGDSGVGTGNRDRIGDFDEPYNDVIDLSALSSTGLTFKKMSAFDAANQVRYTLDSANNLTIVQINLDTNLNTAEMEIELVGFIPLNASEFLLTPAV